MNTKAGDLRYVGRFGQTFVCLGRLFRSFIFQNEWKVLPMSAVIAALVAMAIGSGLFTTMEGTLQGTFALACVCIWNGFFNSIQSVCRERAILKREHRAGLHITSYVLAQMIYQMILCILQSLITLIVCQYAKVVMPAAGVIADDPTGELLITLFLITFAADMLALLISSLVHSATTAMTLMPFML
ncbi:MAG: ABC transporter permease, partial [Lachnospiraceae bacterium]|nr:ABC transporter permease [Lachnospiraceae bacterium]